jgi:archaellum component FlaC
VDQDLKAYLEALETRMEARLDERFARMDERFTRVDERLERMDERFARVDERFARVDERLERMDERFTRVDERFERMETEVRHTGVLVEAVNANVRLLAEGVIGTGERIDALYKETSVSLKEIKGSVDLIHQILVPRVHGLEDRVKILEDKAARENRDVLEIIRERFGLRQAQ